MKQEIITKAEEIIKSKTGYIGDGMEGYATLSLIDENGYPTSSTYVIAKAEGIKWLTFNTSLSRDIVKRINKCNRASVCINSVEYNITLVGTFEILTDSATKKEMWHAGMERHWTGPDDPEYCVLRFTTERYNLFIPSVSYEEAKGTLQEIKKETIAVHPMLVFNGQCNQAI